MVADLVMKEACSGVMVKMQKRSAKASGNGAKNFTRRNVAGAILWASKTEGLSACGQFLLNLLQLLYESLPFGGFTGEFAAKRGSLFPGAGDAILGFPDCGEFLAEIMKFPADLDDFF